MTGEWKAWRRVASLALCLGAAALPRGVAAEAASHEVPRTNAAITVDAILDEPSWARALKLDLGFEVQPGENIAPPVETEVLLSYDDSRLYIAFRCYDPDPSAIRAHLRDRDSMGSDDWVGVILDTFNDERRSFDLLVSPLGVQSDFIETDSGGGSWDAIWDSAGRITDWGYAVELAIPFSQLRFQRAEGPQTWGFDAVRSYPRSQRHHIGVFPRDRDNNCYLCQAIKISGFAGASPGRNLQITPTATALRSDALDEFPNGDLVKANEEAELGITGRWGITPNLTLGATLNPDFSQVEADALQLDINQPFALWYPERRTFFMEGSDFFQTLKSAVYTRTLRDPILGGKISGKEGVRTLGAYIVRDELTNLIFPGSVASDATTLDRESTAGVMRYKHDIGSSYTLGALYTGRKSGSYSNHLAGLDGDLRLSPSHQIQFQFMRSRTEYPTGLAADYRQPESDFSGNYVALEYDHYTNTVGWWLDYDQVDEDFRADLGFIPRVGVRNIEGGLMRFWRTDASSWWSRFTAATDYAYYEDHDGKPLDRGAAASLSYHGAMQSWAAVQIGHYLENYAGRQYELQSYFLQAGFEPTGDLDLGFTTQFGDRIDYSNSREGDRLRISPYLNLHLGRHLRFDFDHSYERFDVAEGRLYDAWISNLTAVYQRDVRTMFRAILQHAAYDRNEALYVDTVEPEERSLFAQFLFSYKINPPTVLFMGYNDSLYGDQDSDLTRVGRTFFAKIGYAWVI